MAKKDDKIEVEGQLDGGAVVFKADQGAGTLKNGKITRLETGATPL